MSTVLQTKRKSAGKHQSKSVKDKRIIRICSKSLLLFVFAWMHRSSAHLCQVDLIDSSGAVLDRNDNCFEKYRGKVVD